MHRYLEKARRVATPDQETMDKLHQLTTRDDEIGTLAQIILRMLEPPNPLLDHDDGLALRNSEAARKDKSEWG